MGIELSSGFADVPRMVMEQASCEMLVAEGLSQKLSENWSARVAELAEIGLEAPEIRWERIAVLKKQIAAGRFQVSAEDLANAILTEMRVQAR
jgi:anti-sigma28 factor (negative regulator of flagellin synthesis)